MQRFISFTESAIWLILIKPKVVSIIISKPIFFSLNLFS